LSSGSRLPRVLAAGLLFIGATAAAPMPAAPTSDADPEDGVVRDGAYMNPYFGLSMPLPEGWTKGLDGPLPSTRGYYVLANLTPVEAPTATMLITAQDLFFEAKPAADAAEAVRRFAVTLGEGSGLTLSRPPREVTIAGLVFTRLDYEGAGLYHALFATDRRCHVLSFALTARDSEAVERLARSLEDMRWTDPSDETLPLCVREQPAAERRARALSAALAPAAEPVPVRLIISADGRVRHVHVISAPSATAEFLTVALAHWVFDPYLSDGQPVAIETGVTIGTRP
jgi:hypothetical protein